MVGQFGNVTIRVELTCMLGAAGDYRNTGFRELRLAHVTLFRIGLHVGENIITCEF